MGENLIHSCKKTLEEAEDKVEDGEKGIHRKRDRRTRNLP